MRPRRWAVSVLVAALVPLLTAPHAVASTSIGISPAVLTFDPALRGGTVERSIELFTDGTTPTTVAVRASGAVASWITMFDERTPQPIGTDRVVVPPGRNVFVGARLVVPRSAPNGSYTGSVTITPQGADGGVGVATVVHVVAMVTGSEVVSGQLLAAGPSVAVQAVGSPLRITALVRNTGNVDLAPTLEVTIERGSTVVGAARAADDTIHPGDTGELVATWRPAQSVVGDYRATIAASDGTSVFGRREAAFRLVAAGSLAASAAMTIKVVARGAPGGAAQAVATVIDTGQQELEVRFNGRVSHPGVADQPVVSSTRIVGPGATVELALVVPTPERGSYTVAGAADLGDGRSTPEERVMFRVGAADGGWRWAPWAALVSVPVLLVAAGWWRRRARAA